MNKNDLNDLVAKQEIRDVLSKYCRSLDRMDRAMANSVFHTDAKVNYHGIYKGSGYGFVDYVWKAHAAMQRHSHQISNVLTHVLTDVQETKAASESYVTVLLWTLPDDNGEQQEITVRGRYLDRWCKQDHTWVILMREHIIDTHTVNKLSCGPISQQSTRDNSDPSYGYIPDRGNTD
jgi:SnoaL-like domain